MNKACTALRFIILTALLASIALFMTQGTAKPQERHIEVIARKFSYSPNIVTLNRGDKVSIRLISEDVHHGLFIDGYNLNATAYPGSDGYMTFVADKTGTFAFRCSVTCGEHHPYMVGSLKVLPDRNFFISLWIAIAAVALPLWKLRE